MKFHTSKNIGVLISKKPGQLDLKPLNLEKRFPKKKFYFFLADEIRKEDLENFNFIDIFVNSACPRIAYDEFENISLINLEDIC